MHFADWLVFGATLGYVAWYGLWRARGTDDVRTFVLAGRHVPWYAVGLSIMATQASSVTFISTTGQAYVDGMRFVQFYFGSLFYGGMLGVFVLAFFFPRVTARGALYGVLVGQIVIFACWKYTGLAFLWYNVLGCVVVVLTGLALSVMDHRERAAFRSAPGASEPSGSEGPIA